MRKYLDPKIDSRITSLENIVSALGLSHTVKTNDALCITFKKEIYELEQLIFTTRGIPKKTKAAMPIQHFNASQRRRLGSCLEGFGHYFIFQPDIQTRFIHDSFFQALMSLCYDYQDELFFDQILQLKDKGIFPPPLSFNSIAWIARTSAILYRINEFRVAQSYLSENLSQLLPFALKSLVEGSIRLGLQDEISTYWLHLLNYQKNRAGAYKVCNELLRQEIPTISNKNKYLTILWKIFKNNKSYKNVFLYGLFIEAFGDVKNVAQIKRIWQQLEEKIDTIPSAIWGNLATAANLANYKSLLVEIWGRYSKGFSDYNVSVITKFAMAMAELNLAELFSDAFLKIEIIALSPDEALGWFIASCRINNIIVAKKIFAQLTEENRHFGLINLTKKAVSSRSVTTLDKSFNVLKEFVCEYDYYFLSRFSRAFRNHRNIERIVEITNLFLKISHRCRREKPWLTIVESLAIVNDVQLFEKLQHAWERDILNCKDSKVKNMAVSIGTRLCYVAATKGLKENSNHIYLLTRKQDIFGKTIRSYNWAFLFTCAKILKDVELLEKLFCDCQELNQFEKLQNRAWCALVQAASQLELQSMVYEIWELRSKDKNTLTVDEWSDFVEAGLSVHLYSLVEEVMNTFEGLNVSDVLQDIKRFPAQTNFSHVDRSFDHKSSYLTHWLINIYHHDNDRFHEKSMSFCRKLSNLGDKKINAIHAIITHGHEFYGRCLHNEIWNEYENNIVPFIEQPIKIFEKNLRDGLVTLKLKTFQVCGSQPEIKSIPLASRQCSICREGFEIVQYICDSYDSVTIQRTEQFGGDDLEDDREMFLYEVWNLLRKNQIEKFTSEELAYFFGCLIESMFKKASIELEEKIGNTLHSIKNDFEEDYRKKYLNETSLLIKTKLAEDAKFSLKQLQNHFLPVYANPQQRGYDLRKFGGNLVGSISFTCPVTDYKRLDSEVLIVYSDYLDKFAYQPMFKEIKHNVIRALETLPYNDRVCIVSVDIDREDVPPRWAVLTIRNNSDPGSSKKEFSTGRGLGEIERCLDNIKFKNPSGQITKGDMDAGWEEGDVFFCQNYYFPIWYEES